VDCRIITDFTVLAALEPEWKRLWDESSRPEIFNSFDYVSAWWSIHGPSYGVFTPVVYDGARVVAILPLVMHHGVLHFFCFTDADFFDVLCEKGVEQQALSLIFSGLRRQRAQWRWAVLDNVPQDSTLLRSGAWVRGSGIRSVARPINICPTLDLREGRDESFERLIGGKRNRQEERRLQRFGDISFTHLESRDQVRGALAGFFQQHTDRWAVEGVRGRFTNEASRKFYAAMVERLDPARELRFSVLRAGGKDMAYHLGFESHGRMLFFKPTFDVDYWEFSPGKVLLQKLLQYAKDTGLEEFDFSIGDEDYKKKFANDLRTNYRLILTHAGLPSRIQRLKVLVDSALRNLIGEEHIADLRRWRDAAFPSGWGRRLLASMRMSGTRGIYVIKPGAEVEKNGAQRLHDASLSWLAQHALLSPDFVPLQELQTARDWIKDAWRFVYISSATHMAGGWLKQDGTQIAVNEVRFTSEPLLVSFLTAIRGIVNEARGEAVVRLRD
jgi:CelD/BcsL family acetyltransferase involved in cellulose biosynthesis